MQFTKTLQNLQPFPQAPEEVLLKAKAKAPAQVRALQVVLYGLGFGKLLNWHKYRADGDYGGSTTAALAAFQQANGLQGDGRQLDAQSHERLLQLYQVLPALRTLAKAVDTTTMTQWLSTVDRNTMAAITNLSGRPTGMPLTATDLPIVLTSINTLLGPDWRTALHEGDAGGDPATQLTTSRATLMDGWFRVRFNRKDKGVWYLGDERPLAFIETYQDELLQAGLSESLLRVITPPSNNEGNLDAINTWDDSFLSFGMFQWTMGQRSNPGELAAFLGRLQAFDPTVFERYFGQYGIDASTANRTTGYLSWKGTRIKTVAAKEKLRKGPDWAFRFWIAGLDTTVQLVQILHAADRVRSFYTHPEYQPLDFFAISDLITSEYGVCLLLDHHVNRPGHLMRHAIGKNDIIGRAMKAAGLAKSDPTTWDTAEETRLLEAYLPLRYRSSMTHSAARAKKIQGYRDRGLLSAERHSFSLDGTRSRSLSPSYDPSEYPLIDPTEYESVVGDA